ncbi:MAG: hypothetical protein ACRC5R_04940 [Mycoplasmatales bacterium]
MKFKEMIKNRKIQTITGIVVFMMIIVIGVTTSTIINNNEVAVANTTKTSNKVAKKETKESTEAEAVAPVVTEPEAVTPVVEDAAVVDAGSNNTGSVNNGGSSTGVTPDWSIDIDLGDVTPTTPPPPPAPVTPPAPPVPVCRPYDHILTNWKTGEELYFTEAEYVAWNANLMSTYEGTVERNNYTRQGTPGCI